MADETRRTRGRPRGSATRVAAARRSRRVVAAPNGGDSASALLQSVQKLVSENQALVRDNDRLRAVLSRIIGLAGETSGATTASVARPRGRRAPAAAAADGGSSTPKRTRRPITDPVALQRRRDALAKARAVRAAKLRGES